MQTEGSRIDSMTTQFVTQIAMGENINGSPHFCDILLSPLFDFSLSLQRLQGCINISNI